jgi:hypothetical protein
VTAPVVTGTYPQPDGGYRADDPAVVHGRRPARPSGPSSARPVRPSDPGSARRPGGATAPASRPGPQPAATRRPAPTGRLGLLWSVALVLSTLAGPVVVALLVAPVAFVAALSLARRAGAPTAPRALWPAGAAALVPLAAIAGPLAAVVVLVIAVAAVAVVAPGAMVAPGAGGSRPWAAVTLAAPAAASASLVLADHGSTGVALCLASAICLFDVANYLVGTGANGGLLGAFAGILTVGVLAVLVAAVINPPLSGSRPWVLCGLVAALAPVGVILGARLARGARLPALRRLDSLILAGPAWVIASHILLP